MNIGDKLYCKKECKNILSEVVFFVGKVYYIDSFAPLDSLYYPAIFVRGENFNIPLTINNINEYFYTTKELRKRKLGKLNDCRF